MNTFTIGDKHLVSAIDADLERFAKVWRTEATRGSEEPVEAFCNVMLRGGKRLRGILAAQSYYAHGGKDERVAIGIARVFEILQTSLLLIDDIADRSLVRRGGPSAHAQIAGYAEESHMKGSADRYGEAQAMNIAYAGFHQATIELLNIAVDPAIARYVYKQFHENIAVTINGQIDDIYNEMTNKSVTEEAIESVLIRKTAYYTVLSPLQLGASLAGEVTLSPALRDYAVHAGCVFQIADDIISTFGRTGQTGKGQDDDIREGKRTLLAHHALTYATTRQRKELRLVLGKDDATSEECDRVRVIFRDAGSIDYAKRRLKRHENLALEALSQDEKINKSFSMYLRELALYMGTRHI